MRTAIGRLRHRLAVESAQHVPDGGGGSELTWTIFAYVWAAIHPTSGTEVAASDTLSGRITHEIILRYRPGIRPSMRLSTPNRQFEILAIMDLGERRRWLKCLCLERDI